MITKTDFLIIEQEVVDAVNECFTAARNGEARPNEYVCFLAQADYNDSLPIGYSPYCIDEKMDYYIDLDRQNFLLQFLNHRYDFNKHEVTDDNVNLTTIELMTYSHIWEAKPYLKMLRRLACLCASLDFEWQVNVPEMGKHNFIRLDIRDIFRGLGLKIADVMTNGFHSQLRNAFAHSDYSFQIEVGNIYLFNYKGGAHEMQKIAYDDWTRRFCYTFLLNYYIYNTFHETREDIHNIYGATEFVIPQPDGQGGFRQMAITYRPQEDMFQFK